MISEEKRERIREAIETLIQVDVSSKKIKSIGVNSRARHLPKMTIKVGVSYTELEPGAPSEAVIAIFESKLFCVCTESRNGIDAPPYYFLREDVFAVEEME